jgi:hypothetical protein
MIYIPTATGVDGESFKGAYVCVNNRQFRSWLTQPRHSNVLRIKGISALQSDHHFIVYDNGTLPNSMWIKLRRRYSIQVIVWMQRFYLQRLSKTTLEGVSPLDLQWSDKLNFLSDPPRLMRNVRLQEFLWVWTDKLLIIVIYFPQAGISHLCMQGVWSRSMGVTVRWILTSENPKPKLHKNFHILVDPEDLFSIIITAPHSQEVETAALQESEDNALVVFNALLDKVSLLPHRLLIAEPYCRLWSRPIDYSTVCSYSLPVSFLFHTCA